MLLLLTGALVAAGCAALPRIEVPAALPNSTREQFLTLRWALLRDGTTVRAVGLAETSSASPWNALVALEGFDASGRVVSRGSSAIHPGFDAGTTAFEVELVPTGAEAEFRLRVVRAQQSPRPPGRQGRRDGSAPFPVGGPSGPPAPPGAGLGTSTT